MADVVAFVIDAGSACCKAGLSCKDEPDVVFKTAVGHQAFPEVQGMFSSERWREMNFVADELVRKAAVSDIVHPISRGVITNWEDMEYVWDYCFDKVRSEEHPLVLSTSVYSSRAQNHKICEIMFEKYKVPSLYMVPEPLLCCYGLNIKTGLLISSGADVTTVLPMYEGYPIYSAIQNAGYGSNDVTKQLIKLLTESGRYLNTPSEIRIADAIKETLGATYQSAEEFYKYHPAECFGQCPKEHKDLYYTLPDGQIMNIGRESYECMEVMFTYSEKIGQRGGIPRLLEQSVAACPIFIRKSVRENIYLAGGCTNSSGFKERISSEVKAYNTVTGAQDNRFCAWRGGGVLARMESFKEICLVNSRYEESEICEYFPMPNHVAIN